MKKLFIILACSTVCLMSCTGPQPNATMGIDGSVFRFCNIGQSFNLGLKFQTWEEWLQLHPDYPAGENIPIDEAVQKSLKADLEEIEIGVNLIIEDAEGNPWSSNINSVVRASDGYSLVVNADLDCHGCKLILRGTASPAFQNENGTKLGVAPIPDSGIIPDFTDPIDMEFNLTRSIGPC